MGVWVHGQPGAYIVVTLVSLIRKDFIDGAGWMLGEHWWDRCQNRPGWRCWSGAGCGDPFRIGLNCVRIDMGKWSGVIHCCPVCRSPTMVRACWCSWSASGVSVGQEVMILGGSVALAVGGLQMVSSESAEIFAMVWAHSAPLLVGGGVGRSGVAACGLVV